MFLGKYAGAQNLVPNPSFEEYDTCPDWAIQLDRANHWFYVSDGTSDYFNSCDPTPNNVSVPNNYWGFQEAHTGKAYVGLVFSAADYLYMGSHFQWIEYLGVKLLEPMQNRLYKVSFYISLVDSVGPATPATHTASQGLNVFNCAFVRDTAFQPGTKMLDIEPDFEVILDQPVTDSLGWTKIEGYCYGNEGDQYMVIGQLNKDYTKYKSHYYTYFGTDREIVSFYYYDDIGVVMVSEDEFPNIFTPNGDGFNDEFDLKINCLDCGLQLQIYNRWGQLLEQNNTFKWNGMYNGNSCSDGVYYYVLNDTVNKKAVYSGFFQLQKQ